MQFSLMKCDAIIIEIHEMEKKFSANENHTQHPEIISKN